MTSPSAYIREEKEFLNKIAWKIRKIPKEFRDGKGRFDLSKVQRMLNSYGS